MKNKNVLNMKEVKKTYLVTGGAGFIGSAIATKLIKSGHHVFIIDNLSTGKLENIPKGSYFIEGNCGDSSVFSVLLKYTIEAIYHIAGQSSGEVSFEDPEQDLKSNVQSTLILLQFAKSVGCKKFIYASSMSVYGIQKDLPVNETVKPKPVSFYAVGKLASEHYLRIFESFGIKTIALRLFNVYGPGQNLKNLKQGMASIYLAQALEGKRIVVKGSTLRFRDFVYISDVVKCFLKCEDEQVLSGVYNICTGQKVMVQEILDNIKNSISKDIEIVVVDGTLGDQYGIYGDPLKSNKIFGFSCDVNFSDGMAEMIKWAKNK